jgi:hypothetical protein
MDQGRSAACTAAGSLSAFASSIVICQRSVSDSVLSNPRR